MSTPAWQRGLRFFERGWLSSNNVLLLGHGEATGTGGDGAVLVDSGHSHHAAQTLALVTQALGGQRLARIVNTHLHSDHCGGNALLQRQLGCRIEVPPAVFEAARRWDRVALSHAPTGQHCERFRPDAVLRPGSTLRVGLRAWEVLAAPGHDPHAVVLFDATEGVLISADTLWGNGFGVLFPELDGEGAFDEQAAMLDGIERLAPRWVLPGHGPAFDDVAAALARARRRLARFVAEPHEHLRHGARVLIKYHLMECRSTDWPELQQWLQTTPLLHSVWQRLGQPQGALRPWAETQVQALVARGALTLQGPSICDAERAGQRARFG